ncbi:heterokaryon incompatibility protein-domain-containing protein [Hypoxylon cercidicola]|nr:heterokaryon incompatibility protein-domain-containing protein [Hypoxylon cercidicola]
MLCQTCQTSIQATFDALYIPGDSAKKSRHLSELRILHHTPLCLYKSVVIGCFICRNIWISDLRIRNALVSDNHLQQAFEGKPPRSYEEFCDQYGSIGHYMKGFSSSAKFTQSPNVSIPEIGNGLAPTSGVESPRKFSQPSNARISMHSWIQFNAGWRETGYSFGFFADSKFLLHMLFEQIPETSHEFHSSKYPQLRLLSPSTAGSTKLWCHWLHTCLESHVQCCVPNQRQQTFVPDRLIEILKHGKGSDIKWRLVHSKDIGIVPYFTLSHCWGTSNRLKLKRDNYSQLMKASPNTRLPKTYQEALQIVASLDFRYIWIDSLCIVQDDKDSNDWKIQSSKMGLIYRSAYCNIAATWAKDGADGCFSERNPRLVDPMIKSISKDNRSLYYRATLQPNYSYNEDILFAPLNKRAWVVQERYLARRQLSFSKRQVYWECFELSASEQYPNGLPLYLRETKPSMEVFTPKAWCALVDWYSRCDATRKSDKLIALAGLAGESWKAADITDEYLAGLWKNNLSKQLCWRVDGRRVNRSRISPYIAPTWSWASLDSPIVSDVLYYQVDCCYSALGEVIGASVGSSDDTKPHSFTDSKLVLRRIAMRAHATSISAISLNDSSIFSFPPEVIGDYELGLSDELETIFIKVGIYWDENMSDAEAHNYPERWIALNENRTKELLFLCVWFTVDRWRKGHPPTVFGLVLRMLPGFINQNSYVRMGTFRTTNNSLITHIAKRLGFRAWGTGTLFVEDTRGNDEYVGLKDFQQVWGQSMELNDPKLADLIHTVTVV